MAIGIIPSIFFYLLLSTWIVYVCFLSDPSKSPTAHYVTQTLPKSCLSFIGKILGPKAVHVIERAADKLLAILYLVIVLGSWSVVFTHCYSFIDRSKHVSSLHKYSGYVVFFVCIWSWHKARTTSPGFINERNISRFDNYPYDGFLFVNENCRTLGIRKLPRSKYDRFTNKHVARFDHFCGFIDNTVGEENYRFFLLFLIIHVGMCIYGTYVIASLFWGEIQDRDLLNAIFFNGITGEEVKADTWIVGNYLFMKYFALCAVLTLLSVMALVLGLFFAFHLYISACGMTTNEFFKWRQVKKWHVKATSKYSEAQKKDTSNKNRKLDNMAKENAIQRLTDDVDVGCVGPLGGGEQKHDNKTEPECNSEDDPGPFPTNIYHCGIIENFKEVIYPRSRRSDAIARFRASFNSDDSSASSKNTKNAVKIAPGKSKAK